MCPYCGGDCFVGSTIRCHHCGIACYDASARPDGVTQAQFCILGFEQTTSKWLNECKGCGKWCEHHDEEGVTHELVDPFDPNSEVVV